VDYRVCRDCGEEFRPEIERCSDCGGELVAAHEDETGQAVTADPVEATASAEDLADFRPIFVGAQAALLVPLAEALKGEGIAFRLAEELSDPERGTVTFGLLVREADRAGALRALAPLLGEEASTGRLQAVETHFGESGSYSRCPACESEVALSATECPECGLVIAGGGAPS
jgi:rRNA maturation protein Nop10